MSLSMTRTDSAERHKKSIWICADWRKNRVKSIRPALARWSGGRGEVGDEREGPGRTLSRQPPRRGRQRRALSRAGRGRGRPEAQQVYRRLAAVEEAHAEFWRSASSRLGAAAPAAARASARGRSPGSRGASARGSVLPTSTRSSERVTAITTRSRKPSRAGCRGRALARAHHRRRWRGTPRRVP